MRKLSNISLGADPEMFYKNKEEFVSAEGLVGGSKENPREISNEGHAIQEDNVLVEFNIPPSYTKKQFKRNINYCMNYIRELGTLQGLTIGTEASAIMDDKYLQTDHARQFSCERDFNAHTRDVNPIINSNTNLRSAGGHIHIGYEDPDEETSEKIILMMDLILGLPSLFMDKDTRRRELYGKAGCFRFKPFGVEYRTLSNFWIHDEDLLDWVYDSTLEVISLINKGVAEELISRFAKEAEEAINDNNKELASSLIEGIEKTIEEFETINQKQ